MSNLQVPANTRGLSAIDSLWHRFFPNLQGWAIPPDTISMEPIMSISINRRSLTTALVAASATGVTSHAFEPPLGNVETASVVAQLIENFCEAEKAYDAAWDDWCELKLKTELPEVRVIGGHWRVIWEDKTVEDTDPSGRVPIWLHSHEEIDRHCDIDANPCIPGLIEVAEKKRTSLHAELDLIADEEKRIRRESGLDASANRRDRALAALENATTEMLRHSPTTLGEYQMRDAFLSERIKAGLTFSDQDLENLFSN